MKKTIERIRNIGIIPTISNIRENEISNITKTLVASGIDCIQIKFENESSINIISKINNEFNDVLLGVSNIDCIDQANAIKDYGVSFITTNNSNDELLNWGKDNDIVVIVKIKSFINLDLALNKNIDIIQIDSSQISKDFYNYVNENCNTTFIIEDIKDIQSVVYCLTYPNIIAINYENSLINELIINKDYEKLENECTSLIKEILDYSLIHIGINHSNETDAKKSATLLSKLFNLKYYQKPKSSFAGKYFECLNTQSIYKNGHFGIYTPFPNRAMYQLEKSGIGFKEETITYNKKTGLINFVYLDIVIADFGVHLINPDVKM